MNVTPTQPFMDGGTRYEPGTTYDVAPERAEYFAAQGWIEGGSPNGHHGEVTLTIDNIHHDQEARF